MVKYGKLYRELHIPEFIESYIDYKKLKQKIKEIQNYLPQINNNSINFSINSNQNLKLRPTMASNLEEGESQEKDKYLILLAEFKSLLNEEFQKCFKFFKLIRKQLHNKINRHLYTQTNYTSYNLDEFLNEITNIRGTIYLAKCLNDFINDNMTALKKILKKFDKKFSNYYGNIGPKYILENLSDKHSDMEYLLQFKIIDETSTICESNLRLLNECFKEYCLNNEVSNEKKLEFEEKYNSINQFIKDIDEIIYFRIQYKEWFYYTKKESQIISQSKLFKNLMFNPILFSAYHKDDLMNKFLSRKEEIKDIEKMQIAMTLNNKINMVLIFIHNFFYNTLISGIYPLLFELMGETKDKSFIPYSLLIIASTYLFSYFSIIFHNCFGNKNIRTAYVVSYIFFMLGSFSYIFSYQKNEENEFNEALFKSSMIGFLIFSRIIIGLGATPTIGKNYILNYSSKYFLPYISKIYVFISILGHSFGPLIGFFLYEIPDIKFVKFLYYSKFNSIGWYGFIMSFILLILHLILFTSPYSKKFKRIITNVSFVQITETSEQTAEAPFLDLEDTQDKEFYQLQKEKIKEENDDNEFMEHLENNEEDNTNKARNLSDDEIKIITTEENNKLSVENEQNKYKTEIKLRKSNTLAKNENLFFKSLTTKKLKEKNESNDYQINPLLKMGDLNEVLNIKDECQEEGTFSDVNMIPRAIEEIIRKEKTNFGYLNKNLLMILFTLFFNNLLKENIVAYCSYYFYYLITFESEIDYLEPKYLSLFISVSYLLEIFSMPFILPLYKLNKLIKKFLIALMFLSLLLMIPITISKFLNIYIYFIINSLIFLISSIIEVLSSCYLAYLTPPEWKFSHFNAGMLPLIIMTFGKLSGCLICLSAFTENLNWNHYIIIGLSFIGYGISSIFILKSKNFRIKAISRIMRKTELEQNVI